MIALNLTLIVQIVHFCIAYFLIKTLFLKPLLEAIEQEDTLDQKLRRTVLDAEKERLNQEQLNTNLWTEAQRGFAKMRPISEHEPVRAQASFVAPVITDSEIKKEQIALANDVIGQWNRNES